jgi:hypothetical protein
MFFSPVWVASTRLVVDYGLTKKDSRGRLAHTIFDALIGFYSFVLLSG